MSLCGAMLEMWSVAGILGDWLGVFMFGPPGDLGFWKLMSLEFKQNIMKEFWDDLVIIQKV